MPVTKVIDPPGTILTFIKQFVRKNGHTPTIKQICEGTGYKSTASVHTHLCKLERLGKIRRPSPGSRAMVVL